MSSKFKVKDSKFVRVKIKLSIISSFIGLLTVACMQNAPAPRSGVIIAESKSYEASLFRQNCAICHGAEGNGKQMDGRLIPSLRFGDAAKKSEEEIYLQIRDGKLPMPAFKNQLSEKELRQMTLFVIKDLQGRSQTETNK